MSAIEKRARELLAEQYRNGGASAAASEILAGRSGWPNQMGLAAIVAAMAPPEGYVLVPVEPTEGRLMSMALRSDHALGFPGYYDQEMLRYPGGPTHQQRLEAAISDARRHYEEVVGTGFYSPDKEASYAAMLAARPEVP